MTSMLFTPFSCNFVDPVSFDAVVVLPLTVWSVHFSADPYPDAHHAEHPDSITSLDHENREFSESAYVLLLCSFVEAAE